MPFKGAEFGITAVGDQLRAGDPHRRSPGSTTATTSTVRSPNRPPPASRPTTPTTTTRATITPRTGITSTRSTPSRSSARTGRFGSDSVALAVKPPRAKKGVPRLRRRAEVHPVAAVGRHRVQRRHHGRWSERDDALRRHDDLAAGPHLLDRLCRAAIGATPTSSRSCRCSRRRCCSSFSATTSCR